MKKIVLAVAFLLLFMSMHAAESANLRIYLNYPRNITSNGKTNFSFDIRNEEDKALNNLEISMSSENGLEVSLDRSIIGAIRPGETVTVNVEIVNNRKYYFSEETFVTLIVSNDEYFNSNRYRFTIKPVENFWVILIASIASLLTVLFIVLFIRLNKGEENAG